MPLLLPSLPSKTACLLALGAALACHGAQAQNLQQSYELARAYDSAYQAAQAQLDAAASRAEQARAGLLPTVGLGAGLSRGEVIYNVFSNLAALETNPAMPGYDPADPWWMSQTKGKS